ncbi:hypothetical protein [Reticulibacter mediterranei]|nr:hypothetical protein [Reticulibacter mediterranei]
MPTRIRPFTAQDLVEIGPTFTDREGHIHTVEPEHCLCVGPLGDRWSCSLEDLKQDRYPVSLPDHEGFRWYRERHPRALHALHVTEPFDLDCQDGKPALQCNEDRGGYITWNSQPQPDQDLRVVQGTIFLRTYACYTLFQKLKKAYTPIERGTFSLTFSLLALLPAQER